MRLGRAGWTVLCGGKLATRAFSKENREPWQGSEQGKGHRDEPWCGLWLQWGGEVSPGLGMGLGRHKFFLKKQGTWYPILAPTLPQK